MNRFAVIGASGSGKTTLGQNLAARTGVTAIDLDELNWRPNWQQASPEEFDQLLTTALKQPQWVVSGNYSRVQERYLEAAEVLIWLDYSFLRVFWQILKRTSARVILRRPCCNGNYESLSRTFSRDSIVLWLFQTYWKRRKKTELIFENEKYAHLEKLRFRTPRQTKQWLDSM